MLLNHHKSLVDSALHAQGQAAPSYIHLARLPLHAASVLPAQKLPVHSNIPKVAAFSHPRSIVV